MQVMVIVMMVMVMVMRKREGGREGGRNQTKNVQFNLPRHRNFMIEAVPSATISAKYDITKFLKFITFQTLVVKWHFWITGA